MNCVESLVIRSGQRSYEYSESPYFIKLKKQVAELSPGSHILTYFNGGWRTITRHENGQVTFRRAMHWEIPHASAGSEDENEVP